jgi:hypothetical protein
MDSKVCIGKHLSDNFPIQNGLKQGDVLSALFLNFALEHGIRKVQEIQVEFKLNGTHQLLVYADDVNLLGKLRYLGITITNQNLIQKEIKRRLNSGNACYHSVQNLLSSRLLSKNVKIRIYKIILELLWAT